MHFLKRKALQTGQTPGLCDTEKSFTQTLSNFLSFLRHSLSRSHNKNVGVHSFSSSLQAQTSVHSSPMQLRQNILCIACLGLSTQAPSLGDAATENPNYAKRTIH